MIVRLSLTLTLLFGAISLSLPVTGQLVGGNCFLRGNYIRLGLASNAAFGSTVNAPDGFVPPGADGRNSPVCNKGKIGFVADPGKDGWETGNPAYVGEYFLPGTPEEGWAITMNGVDYNNNRSSEYIDVPNLCNAGTQIPGSFTSFLDLPDRQIAEWTGMINGLKIVKTITLLKEKLFFTTEVKFTNTTGTTITDTYYMRNVDPDNEVVLTGSYKTNNKIEFQNPLSNNKALVSARGPEFSSYLGLGTIDCRAKVCFNGSPGFLVNRSPRDVYNGVAPRQNGLGDKSLFDAAIAISFRMGDIAPGASVQCKFVYILSIADLGEGLSSTAPQFSVNGSPLLTGGGAVNCTGATLPINITGGDDFAWSWSPATGLNTTTGANVIYTSQAAPITYTVTGTNPLCAQTKLIITIYPPNIPIANFTTEDTCGSKNVTFVNLSPQADYFWDFGDGNTSTDMSPIHTYQNPGSYQVTLTLGVPSVMICGNALTTTKTFTLRETPSVGIAYSNDACLNMQLTLSGNATVSGSTITAHEWNIDPGIAYSAPSVNHTFTNTGPHEVVYKSTTANGCSAIAKQTIIVESIPVALFEIEDGCVDKMLTVDNSSSNQVGPISKYEWNLGNATMALQSQSPNIYYHSPGDYIVTLKAFTANGCFAETSRPVNIESNPVAAFLHTPACLNTSIQFTNISVNSSGPIVGYNWDFNDGIKSTSMHPVHLFNKERIYRVTLQAITKNGCLSPLQSHALAIVKTVANAGRDTIVFKDSPFRLQARGGSDYTWSPSQFLNKADTSSPVAILDHDQIFTVNIIDQRGCKASDEVKVQVFNEDDIYVPNMFTPNNDGRNDQLRAIAPPGTIYIFEIFNRWGQMVFRTTDAQLGWNGRISGADAAPGVYVWHLRAKTRKGVAVEKKGTATLVR